MPSADRIRESNRFFSSAPPHRADRRATASWPTTFGISSPPSGSKTVTMTTYDVLLPWPEETTVEMVAPRAWRASMREEPVPGDVYTEAPPEQLGLAYHAYSASGDVTAPVVYAGSGNPEDYDRLEAIGIPIKGAIALVRYSVPYSYRGFKALTAQQRGAAGLLIYSDPADDGFGKGTRLPGGTVGASEPRPAWRHRVRLPRAGRSADARMGLDPGRATHRSIASCFPARDHQRSALVEGRARAPRGDRWSRSAAGMARRTAADLSARRRAARRAHACPSRRSSAADLDGDRHDSGKRAARSDSSSSATIVTPGSTAASIRRAERRP